MCNEDEKCKSYQVSNAAVVEGEGFSCDLFTGTPVTTAKLNNFGDLGKSCFVKICEE